MDGPLFEPEGLAGFCDFAEPPPIALDVTAVTIGAANCATKPGAFGVEALGAMVRYCPCEGFDV